MHYSIINPKLNSKFQQELQLRDEELIIQEYYFKFHELEYIIQKITVEILSKGDNPFFNDSIADFHKKSIITNHPEFGDIYYFQLCKLLNYDKYLKLTKNFNKLIESLHIDSIESKISQIESAITFLDYCLLAQRFFTDNLYIDDKILELITFSQKLFYNMIDIAENEIVKKYDHFDSKLR